MDEAEKAQRAAVLAEALTWDGTPFAHRSRVKGSGVDCAHFLIGVFSEAGVLPVVDPGKYSSNWHLSRSEERYLAWANHLAVEVDRPKPADIGLWKFGRCFSHAAIFLDDEKIIHAWFQSGRVQIDPVRMGRLRMRAVPNGPEPRPVKYFDVWAKKKVSL
jgi:cell wall-associated NlpC family hydrolase